MANLRGGSTSGGKQLVTTDTLNRFIYQIQTSELKEKMKKAEVDTKITDFNTTNDYIKNHEKNGIWEVNNASNIVSGAGNTGAVTNFSNTVSRFQMYAPSNKSDLFFRTGLNNTVHAWEKVITLSFLTPELNKKFDKTGGDITGIVNFSDSANFRSNVRVYDANNNENFTFSVSNNKGYLNATSPITELYCNKRIVTAGEFIARDNQTVWHTGNLTPYAVKSGLAANTSANTVKDTGIYQCSAFTDVPASFQNQWCYLEVIKHTDAYVLQKIYTFEGKRVASRTLSANVWQPWILHGNMGLIEKELTTANWTAQDSHYKTTITHSEGTSKVISAILLDKASNDNLLVSFKEVNATTIEVFASEAVNSIIRLTVMKY